WALLDWQATVRTKSTYRVEAVAGPPRAVDSLEIQCTQAGTSLTIDTGAACFTLKSGGHFPFDSVTVAGQTSIGAAGSRLTVEDARGRIFQPRLEQVEISQSGPLRLVARVNGSLVAEGSRWSGCRLSAYLHFFAGLGAVQFDLTLHNPRRAGHPGNRWS